MENNPNKKQSQNRWKPVEAVTIPAADPFDTIPWEGQYIYFFILCVWYTNKKLFYDISEYNKAGLTYQDGSKFDSE